MARSIDDYPATPSVKRITYFSGGTAFVDGFNMIIASVALALMGDLFTPAEAGIYTSAYLIGVFIASFLGGKIGDKLGRTIIYKSSPLVISVISVLLLFVHMPVAVIIGRFLTGLCIGADYPMVSAIVAEYSPSSWRSRGLVILMLAWYIGALAGALVGFCMYGVGDNWPLLFGTIAVPALIFFFGRLSVPESYRWLVEKGRAEEAEKAMKKVYGDVANINDLYAEEDAAKASGDGEPAKKVTLVELFRKGYLKRYVYVALFWSCQCIPVTAIFMFGPTIMQTFGLGEGSLSVLGTGLIYVFIMIGVLPAIKGINKMRRRPLVVVTYAFMTIALALLGIFSNAPAAVIIVLFIIYAIPYGLQSVMDNVYPAELFPTEVRGTAIGSLTSISKIAGAIASYLFPIGLAGMGLGPVVLIGAVISAIGLVASIFMAPETLGKTLKEASSLD